MKNIKLIVPIIIISGLLLNYTNSNHRVNNELSKIDNEVLYKEKWIGNNLLNNIFQRSSKYIDKINPKDILLTNLYTNNKTIKFDVGDLKGAIIDIKIINTSNKKEYMYENIESFETRICSDVDTGYYLIYCTRLEYVDNSIDEEINEINPYLIKDIVVTESNNDIDKDNTDNDDKVINDTINIPIIRYDKYKPLLSQKSEIKSITSSTISILAYNYTTDEISSIQYILIDNDSEAIETQPLTPGDIKAYTFENLQPNKEYTVGYRVLNKNIVTANGTVIEGAWSEYATVDVITNASRNLTIVQGYYRDNKLSLDITSRLNHEMPLYKLKILPAEIPIEDILTKESSISILNNNSIDITNELTTSNTVFATNLQIGKIYAVYVIEVLGNNNNLVKSNVLAAEDSDNYIKAVALLKITGSNSDSESVAIYLIDNNYKEFPPTIDDITEKECLAIIDKVAKINRVQALHLLYSKFGATRIITNHMNIDLNSYINITDNIYGTTTDNIECVEYIEYKLPTIDRVYGID